MKVYATTASFVLDRWFDIIREESACHIATLSKVKDSVQSRSRQESKGMRDEKTFALKDHTIGGARSEGCAEVS